MSDLPKRIIVIEDEYYDAFLYEATERGISLSDIWKEKHPEDRGYNLKLLRASTVEEFYGS